MPQRSKELEEELSEQERVKPGQEFVEAGFLHLEARQHCTEEPVLVAAPCSAGYQLSDLGQVRSLL